MCSIDREHSEVLWMCVGPKTPLMICEESKMIDPTQDFSVAIKAIENCGIIDSDDIKS